jgi:hypothetical protein
LNLTAGTLETWSIAAVLYLHTSTYSGMEKSNLHKYSRLQVFVKFGGGETGGNTAEIQQVAGGLELELELELAEMPQATGGCGVGSSDFDKIFENCFALCSFGMAKDI